MKTNKYSRASAERNSHFLYTSLKSDRTLQTEKCHTASYLTSHIKTSREVGYLYDVTKAYERCQTLEKAFSVTEKIYTLYSQMSSNFETGPILTLREPCPLFSFYLFIYFF